MMENKNITISEFLIRFETLCSDTAKIKHVLSERESNPDTSKDRLMILAETAEYLHLAKSTLYRLVSDRKIPFKKFPGSKRLYFLESEILEWIKNSRKTEI